MNDSPQFENRSRVCPACGLLTPAAIPRCLECGHLPPEIEAEQREQRRAAYFVDELLRRKSPFTFIFIGVNVAMFVLTAFAGGAADPDVLRFFGAAQNDLIRGGEWWRLVVPMFLHVGGIHLAFNMYALWIIGPQLEVIYGSARYVFLYLASGIGGFIASYFFAAPNVVGAGASGALFGLMGVLFVYTRRYKSEIPPLLLSGMQRGIRWTLLINLAITFLIPFISRPGHLGGLATGMLLALVVPRSPLREKNTPVGWVIGQIASLLLVGVAFVAMFAHYAGPRPSWRKLGIVQNLLPQGGDALTAFVENGNAAEKTFLEIQKKLETTPAGTPLPPDLKTSNLKAQEKLAKVPKWNPGADQLIVRLRDLLKDQEAVIDQPDPKAVEALRRKFKEYEQAQREWLEKEGVNYGLSFEESQVK
jgi:membrane associated rhomboid family serine protease